MSSALFVFVVGAMAVLLLVSLHLFENMHPVVSTIISVAIALLVPLLVLGLFG